MSLDASVVGYTTEPYEFKYDWKQTVLYALGIGAKQDELDYLYEGRGPKVHPTFAVVPGYGPLGDLLSKTRANLSMVVHGGQCVRVHRPLPPEGTLHTTGKIEGIYDLKRLAQVILQTRSEFDGEPCFDTEWSIIVRGAGNFGGELPPKPGRATIGSEQPPDWTADEKTLPEQALLYRLSGDLNPLHADPEFAASVGFEQGPVLHGLCTYGFVARAIINNACDGDGDRLQYFTAQFRKPVWPGDVLRTEGYSVEDGRLAIRAFAAGRAEPVVANCWAEIRS